MTHFETLLDEVFQSTACRVQFCECSQVIIVSEQCNSFSLSLCERCVRAMCAGQRSGSRRGSTGRMRFPKAESWVMKKPLECPCACWSAAFCCAAMCCCSALSRTSFSPGREDEDRAVFAPGLGTDWPCSSRRFSLSSSARMATRVLFWKPCPTGGVAIEARRSSNSSDQMSRTFTRLKVHQKSMQNH